jgi:hypothetical protein
MVTCLSSIHHPQLKFQKGAAEVVEVVVEQEEEDQGEEDEGRREEAVGDSRGVVVQVVGEVHFGVLHEAVVDSGVEVVAVVVASEVEVGAEVGVGEVGVIDILLQFYGKTKPNT